MAPSRTQQEQQRLHHRRGVVEHWRGGGIALDTAGDVTQSVMVLEQRDGGGDRFGELRGLRGVTSDKGEHSIETEQILHSVDLPLDPLTQRLGAILASETGGHGSQRGKAIAKTMIKAT